MFIRAGILIAVLLGTGCQSMRFYRQAVAGQWEIISERETITKIIREEPSDSRLTPKLKLTQAIIRFAETNLNLPAGLQYQAYVDLKRPYVVWNVEATPEFSLESKSWWYPIVGRLEYQGYFREQMALDYAGQLRSEGYDVFVGGVSAYSTLGWFKDPIMNTFIGFPEADLAELLFHELAHQKLFISGDTDFNEAFATTVGREGVRRWYAAMNDPGALKRYLERRSRDDQVIALILKKRDELETLYDAAAEKPETVTRQRKAAIIESLREDYASLKRNWNGYRTFDGFMAAPINNAQLNAIDTYFDLVPQFERILAHSGNNLPRLFEIVKSTKRMSKDERRAFLKDWN